MKHALIGLLVVLAATFTNPVRSGERPTPKSTLRLKVDLIDGSRVVGVPAVDHWKLRTESASLELKLALVRMVEFEKNQPLARVNLVNGDRLSGQLSPTSLVLKTDFGEVAIPLAKVLRITASGGGVALDGLILHYTFDQVVKDEVPEQTGNNLPGKMHGGKITPDGKNGSGLQFPEVGGYVTFDDKHLPMENAPRSIAVWFKTVVCPHPQFLFAYGQQTRSSEVYAGIYEDAKVVMLGEYGNRYPAGNGRKTVTDGEWHHFVFVHDGNQTATGYMDGEPDFSTTRRYETSPRGAALVSHTDPGYKFEGTLDEFMIFNRALSAEEVKELHASQK
jgi:hypothetical protein